METTTNQNHSSLGPGWTALKGMQSQAVVATALYLWLYCIASVVFFLVPAVFALYYVNAFEYDRGSFGQVLYVVILFMSVFVPFVTGLAIPGVALTYGYHTYMLRAVRAVRDGAECPGMDVLFSGFRPRVFCTAMLHGFLVTLGLFCYIVPGALLAGSYSLAPFVRYNHPEFSVREALRRSRALMKGRWGEGNKAYTRGNMPVAFAFLLFVPFVGFILLITVATAHAATRYDKILRETEAETDEELELYDKCE